MLAFLPSLQYLFSRQCFLNANNSHLLLLWLMVEVALPGGTDKVGKVAGTELEVKKVVSKMFATSCQRRYF